MREGFAKWEMKNSVFSSLYRFLRLGSAPPQRSGDVEVVQPIIVIFPVVQTMRGALVTGPAARLRLERPKVPQQRPVRASRREQPGLVARTLLS